MPLTDTAIRSAKRRSKSFRLFDSDGLYLEVSPAGGKWWRWKYRFGGKEKRLSFGVHPEVSLKSARDKRDTARRQVAAGIDPGEARRAAKIAKGGSGELRGCRSRMARQVFAGMDGKPRRPDPAAVLKGPLSL